MRSANIADLRNHLTQYLKEVRAGEEIIIRDRQTPIAKIVPLAHDDDAEEAELVAAGLMRKGTGKLPASFWRIRRAAIDPQVAADAVSRDRDED
jgi:prevent-host-death family protein